MTTPLAAARMISPFEFAYRVDRVVAASYRASKLLFLLAFFAGIGSFVPAPETGPGSVFPDAFPFVVMVVCFVLVAGLQLGDVRRRLAHRLVVLHAFGSWRCGVLPCWVLDSTEFPESRRWLARQRLSPGEWETFEVLVRELPDARPLGELVGTARDLVR